MNRVLYFIFSTGCTACKEVKPKVRTLAAEAKIPIVLVDYDDLPDPVADKVKGTPFMVLMDRSSRRQLGTWIGAFPKSRDSEFRRFLAG